MLTELLMNVYECYQIAGSCMPQGECDQINDSKAVVLTEK